MITTARRTRRDRNQKVHITTTRCIMITIIILHRTRRDRNRKAQCIIITITIAHRTQRDQNQKVQITTARRRDQNRKV